MANSIALFKNYVALLDEVYKQAAKTSVLDGDSSLVRAGANANEIVIPKMTLQGLADYSRNNGYVNGDVTLTHETVEFNYDRGRAFQVDAMDDEETAGIAFGQLSSEFLRVKVVPEMDAFRFATYSGLAGTSATSASFSTGNDVLTALITAQSVMDESEVDTEQRILFITPTLYNAAMNVDSYKSKAVMDAFSSVVTVPQTRFYTAIDLYDGTTSGETDGGFVKHVSTGQTDAAGVDINFLIIQKNAVLQYTKHTLDKVFRPEENQHADAWKFCYRAYGLADAYDNKVKGIYLNHK